MSDQCPVGPLLFCAKAQTRLSLSRSDGIKFDICDMSSVIAVIGSVIIIYQIIFNECAISSFKDVFELFNASMHPFKTCANYK